MTGVIILLILLVSSQFTICHSAEFGLARHATPVLNSPDFNAVFGGADGTSLKTDHCGQVRELEFIALPGTVFKIVEELKRGAAKIYRIETGEYPAPAGVRLYVDHRFLELSTAEPHNRVITLPSREDITASLKKAVGSPYVWGGNVSGGVPQLAEWFFRGRSHADNGQLMLKGLDCSGVLYQATGGWTPRNTARLLDFGNPVPILGKSAAQIAKNLEPLDLIVWHGHVIIVLDHETVIESRLECGKPGNGGVVTASLQKRLTEVMRTRRPMDRWPSAGKQRDFFVIRRWYDR